jgi:hypothetical protein
MARGHEDRNEPRNAAREVVTDILAEALWTLICTGHGPSAQVATRSGMRSLSNAPAQSGRTRQPVENTGN